MISEDLRNRLSSLDAFLAAETDDIDEAIDRLSKFSDPESIRRRIALLIKASRYSEAHTVVDSYPTSSEWIEVAIRASIFADDPKMAKRLIIESDTLGDSSGTIRLRSIVSFADAVFAKHMSHFFEDMSQVSLYAISPAFQPQFQIAIDFLLPYCHATNTRQKLTSTLEREAMSLLLICLCLLGRSDETQQFLPILVRDGNIHPMLGHLMADEKLHPVNGFAEALVESNKNDFYSVLFGELIRFSELQESRVALLNLTALVSKAQTGEEKTAIFSALSTVSIYGDRDLTQEFENLNKSILDTQNPQHSLALSIHKIQIRKFDEAEKILEENPLPSDPRWLRALGQCYLEADKIDKGLKNLISSALSYKGEAWLLETSDIAIRNRWNSAAIDCLECVREYYPWNQKSRRNLVSLYSQENLNEKAILESEYLVLTNPNDQDLNVQLAYLYSRANRSSEGIEILDSLVKSNNTSVQILILLSSLLKQSDQQVRAFTILDKHKNEYWESKEFLMAYLESGYASGNDKKANDALIELNKLREKGEIDPKYFRLTSLDEIKGLFEESHKKSRKLEEEILRGRIPWTISAEASKKSIFFDWRVRTQDLKWHPEDKSNRANFSIYSTNCFGSLTSRDSSELREIELTEAVRDICVDYSALLTLYSLGQLELLFSNFDNVYIPEQYRANLQLDRQQIQPHQLSHLNGYRTILSLIDSRDISIASGDELESCLVVDEYSQDRINQNPPARPLKSLIEVLIDSGKLKTSQEDEVSKLSLQDDSEDAAAISLNEKIVVELHTLMTVYRENLLNLLAENFKVHITNSDLDEIKRDIRGFEFQENTLDSFNDLWEQLSGFSNLRFTSVPSSGPDHDSSHDGLALLALSNSKAKDIPLLADDRVLQTIIINEKGTPIDTAFGTDAFLKFLMRKNKIEIGTYAELICRLIKLRYKFILPEAEMLHALVTNYSGNVPGKEMVSVAQYLHDCMRDPGLFGGLESTDPPISMALKLYIKWATLSGEFLALVWTDESIDDERSENITKWVAQVMLPSVPVSINEQFHSNLSSNLVEVLFINTFIRVTLEPMHYRVPNSLRSLSKRLGISNLRHEQLISEVISRAAR